MLASQLQGLAGPTTCRAPRDGGSGDVQVAEEMEEGSGIRNGTVTSLPAWTQLAVSSRPGDSSRFVWRVVVGAPRTMWQGRNTFKERRTRRCATPSACVHP